MNGALYYRARLSAFVWSNPKGLTWKQFNQARPGMPKRCKIHEAGHENPRPRRGSNKPYAVVVQLGRENRAQPRRRR